MPRNIQRNIQVYLQQAPYNIEFTLKKACGDGDWNRLSHGERKSYGKKFLRMVMNEEFACVATRKVSVHKDIYREELECHIGVVDGDQRLATPR
ncbi:MAG: single-stranded DNA-binding protein [Holophagales bacterium]|nr:single-stranded DNA-binding protein [Holophagales bacterium]